MKSGVTATSRRGSRKRLTASVSSDGEGEAGNGLVDSGGHDIFGSSGSSREDREKTPRSFSYSSRNRQRFKGEINRAAESAAM